jgi:heme exporter protein A
LSDVSLRVHPGEVVALFGPNGAGKTTLLRIAAGLSRATGGRVFIDGTDLALSPLQAKRKVGWVADRPMLYDGLTASENLEFFGELWGLSPSDAAAAAAAALHESGLAHRAADRVGDLSRGMQQRLSLARAFLHAPSVLLLDEPFEGLDPAGQKALVDRLRGEKGRALRATLLVTQHVDLGLASCDRAALLDRGALVKVVAGGEFDAAGLSQELRALGGDAPAP